MADPICRWRFATPETIKLLVRLLPKHRMLEADFKKELESNCKAESFDYNGFLTTSYQLAVQLGLYYITDSGEYVPRFDHDLTDSEASDYIQQTSCVYVSPNPYTKSMTTDEPAICLYDYLVQLAWQLPEGSEIDVKKALEDYYHLPLGNTDAIVKLMSQSGSFERVDSQHLKYVGRNKSVSSKAAFFDIFSGIMPKSAKDLELDKVVDEFLSEIGSGGLKYSREFASRFISAVLSRSFVVLTGLSGSGKTKISQAFVSWIDSYCSGKTNLIGRTFGTGAHTYKFLQEEPTVYKILAVDSNRIRSVPKDVVKAWCDYYLEHPEAATNKTRDLRDIINKTTESDSYEHGYDGMLGTIARELLPKGLRYESVDTGARFILVPVGADWTNSEHLLGYPDALQPRKYVMPETGVLKLMLDARDNPDLPFFLILDEMNLSHVERYFADFLSAMESGEDIKLYDGEPRKADGVDIPKTLKFPKNLFVIGTMNVDETTYMFSPKVLDRAQVIEFRVSEGEMKDFLANPTVPNLDAIAGKGAKYAEAFLKLKNTPPPLDASGSANKNAIAVTLNKFFPELAKLGAEFGYRTAGEIVRFCAYYLAAGATIDDAIDAAIVQKILPKLHGSQARLGPVVKKLKDLASKEVSEMADGETKKVLKPFYQLTYEKLGRMIDRLKANGFTSFAEA